MASIGNFDFTVFDGRMMKANRQVALLDPEVGVDGNAIAKGGWRAAPVEIRTIVDLTGTAAAALALVNNYYTLEGQIVPVVDQFGIPWANVTVLNVSAIYSATQTAGVYCIQAVWRLLPQSLPPVGAVL